MMKNSGFKLLNISIYEFFLDQQFFKFWPKKTGQLLAYRVDFLVISSASDSLWSIYDRVWRQFYLPSFVSIH